jgi:WD40 repeat protein
VQFFPFGDEKNLYFLTTSWDGTACRFNLYKPEEKTTFKENIGCLNCCAISPDGTVVALGSKDGKISIWETKGGADAQKS